MDSVSEVRVGEVVVMSAYGVQQGLQGRAKSLRGTVLAIKSPFSIKVLRDGLKCADWYHRNFWDRDAVSK